MTTCEWPEERQREDKRREGSARRGWKLWNGLGQASKLTDDDAVVVGVLRRGEVVGLSVDKVAGDELLERTPR